MSEQDLQGRWFLQAYYRYVGEPERMRDVYGYWLFLIGSVAGLAGIVAYLVEQAFFPGDLMIREAAIVSAAFGLTVALFGIVVLLPVRRNGILASMLGTVISFAGIGLFVSVYPQAWYVPPDYSAEIIAIYGIGVTIITSVAVLVPIITGEKGLFVEPELGIGSDEPPILLGKATRDAFFAVFETPTNEWSWRMIHREAIAESEILARTDTDARLVVEDVREMIGAAGLLDLTTSSFRLYQTEEGEWRWSLVRQDGSVVAVSAGTATDRDAVESTVTFLSEQLPTAETMEIHGAAFDVYRDDSDRWQWRLIDEHRRPLAQSGTSVHTENEAVGATETFVERFENARVLILEGPGFELFESPEGWQWRVVSPTDDRLVTSTSSFSSRQAAESAALAVAEDTAGAPVIEYGTPGYELVPGSDGWSWRLRDETDDLIARSHETRPDRDGIRDRAERTRNVLGDGTIIEYEAMDCEVYPAEDGWRWRLVSDEREVLAESVAPFDDEAEATDTAETVRTCVLAADLIEFDQAAFQQYESDGQWRWRLIDGDGQVLADSGEEYGSQEAVREGMTTLKEHAPDAEVLEIETAAFEIYRHEGGDYAWRLIDEGGTLIAASATAYHSRTAAKEAVAYLTDHVDDAAIRPMREAAFQLFEDDDRWAARLIDVDGAILAETVARATTRDGARDAIDRIKEAGTDVGIDAFGPVTVTLRNGSGWRWDLVDPDRQPIARGDRNYEDQSQARADVESLTDTATEAPVFTIDEGIVWAYEDESAGGWLWELIGPDRATFGEGVEAVAELDEMLGTIETIKTRAGDAEPFEIDTIAIEIVLEDDAWSWRALDEEERIVAVDPGAHQAREDVTGAIDRARGAAADASILEIDDPAFEFHERDEGWVWRLLDDTGEPLAESVEPHESRQAAREEMLSAKEHGPEGETVVTW